MHPHPLYNPYTIPYTIPCTILLMMTSVPLIPATIFGLLLSSYFFGIFLATSKLLNNQRKKNLFFPDEMNNYLFGRYSQNFQDIEFAFENL